MRTIFLFILLVIVAGGAYYFFIRDTSLEKIDTLISLNKAFCECDTSDLACLRESFIKHEYFTKKELYPINDAYQKELTRARNLFVRCWSRLPSELKDEIMQK